MRLKIKPKTKEAKLRRSVAKMARQIENPEQLETILKFTPPEKRRPFLKCIRPFLRFRYDEVNTNG